MGTQKGILKVKGKLGDLSFYKTRDGHLVREKGGVDARRIKRDPAFQRTRENGQEFAMACTAGKLLRMALASLIRVASDGRMTSRLMRIMSQIKHYDTTSPRGERHVALGITAPEAKAMLLSFSFNIHTQLDQVLQTIYATDTATGSFTVADFQPELHIVAPPGATHVSLKSGLARVDFLEGTYALSESAAQNFSVQDTASAPLTLTPTAIPAGTGTEFIVVQLQFFQEVNGVQYVLRNGLYNVLQIVAVN